LKTRRRTVLVVLTAALAVPLLFASCCSYPPLPTVEHVDLPRFMGDWYVVAHIPASSEATAHNAVESYAMAEDGSIATTYAFRVGSFDGELEEMTPSAVVRDRTTNATWGMQFFWPLRFEYLIAWLDPEYRVTLIARSARDYAWIMARTPEIDETTLAQLKERLAMMGYDVKKLRRVPHRWPDPGHPRSG
jgi:apolipoprotein D and lipocalin family protein